MVRNGGARGQSRSSALWGTGNEDDSRSNALWGKGGRGFVTIVAAALVLGIPLGASAGGNGSNSNSRQGASMAYVTSALANAARANPGQSFQVIVQTRGVKGGDLAAKEIDAARKDHPGHAYGVGRRFQIINGASAQLTGAQILDLATKNDVVAITVDSTMAASGHRKQSGSTSTTTTTTTTCDACPYEGIYWPYVTGVTGFWPKPGAKSAPPPQAPTIAIVDSGIDSANTIFGGRVVKQVTLTQLGSNSTGDGYGHGTFVAGLAAGMIGNWGGASPTSNLVSLDVLNDQGMALTSDVIAAADWIYQNKGAYGIRVANFSLHSVKPSSFMHDPLDKAVEELWFGGVVVTAAAGNYAQGGEPSGVLYAPANDPFVLTLGAIDVNGTTDSSDDFNAPWSSFGKTPDGFAKPELGAPGRFMIGAVPPNSGMPAEHPDRVIAPGFMRMSGTSFAAPIAAGAAADLLALHPNWTPDQVKGALMISAKPISALASPLSEGVGELKVDAAQQVTSPPNPNAALDQFLIPDPNGGSTPVFDAPSWYDAVTTDPLWDAVSWSDVSWSDVSWSDVSWSDVSWSDVSWGDGSVSDSSSAAVSWAALAWGD